VHIGRHLGQQTSKWEAKGAEKLLAKRAVETPAGNSGDGSIMIVVATDAPLGSRALERLASRAIIGLARTGSSMSNGSGDYVIAFSTAPDCRRRRGESRYQVAELSNDSMSPLFQAVAEATEEAIYNSLFRATTTKGFRGTVEALPLERTLELLKRAGSSGKTSALPTGREALRLGFQTTALGSWSGATGFAAIGLTLESPGTSTGAGWLGFAPAVEKGQL
jgi:hypothetical protein